MIYKPVPEYWDMNCSCKRYRWLCPSVTPLSLCRTAMIYLVSAVGKWLFFAYFIKRSSCYIWFVLFCCENSIAKQINSNPVFWEASLQCVEAESLCHSALCMSSPALQDCHPAAKRVLFLLSIWLLSASKDTARVLGGYWEVLGVELPSQRGWRWMGWKQLLDGKCLWLLWVLASFAASFCGGHVLCLLMKLVGPREDPSSNFPYNKKKDYVGRQLLPPSSMLEKKKKKMRQDCLSLPAEL